MSLKIVIDWFDFQVGKFNEFYRYVVGIPTAIRHNDLKWNLEQLWRILKWRWRKEE